MERSHIFSNELQFFLLVSDFSNAFLFLLISCFLNGHKVLDVINVCCYCCLILLFVLTCFPYNG